ncbi:MAG: hypothetical protein V4467_01025 [Patescibacteria group bacterium]
MTTIINTPPQNQSPESTGAGILIGITIVILLAILFFLFGLPYLRNQPATETPAKPAASVGAVLNMDTPNNSSGSNTDGVGMKSSY